MKSLSLCQPALEFVKSFTPITLKTSKSYPKKSVNRDNFGKQLRIENLLLIYFEQIVSLSAIIYSNTKSFHLFCENPGLNLANFSDRVIFALILENLTPAQKCFTQVSLVPLVTNSMSGHSNININNSMYSSARVT